MRARFASVLVLTPLLAFVAVAVAQAPPRPWGPEQVTGPPDSTGGGDQQTAWASATQDGGDEWLLCEFANAVRIRSVSVHESYNPGALFKVGVFDPRGEEVVAWEGEDPTDREESQGISEIPVELAFPVQRIKLYFDSAAVPGWNEIDAVSLDEQETGNRHWAARVEASSVYGVATTVGSSDRRGYGPEQAVGPPNIQAPSDSPLAWASLSPDDSPEWLICTFAEPRLAREVVIHENTSPGAVHRITQLYASGGESLLWEGTDPTPRTEPWGVSVFPVEPAGPIRRIKIYIDSPAVPGWNEIDAVGLRGDHSNGTAPLPPVEQLDASPPRPDETLWAAEAEASSTYATPLDGVPLAPEPAPPDATAELAAQVATLREEVQALRDAQQATLEELRRLRETLGEARREPAK